MCHLCDVRSFTEMRVFWQNVRVAACCAQLRM